MNHSFPIIALAILFMALPLTTSGVETTAEKLGQTFDNLDRVELKVRGEITIFADHTPTKQLTIVDHHIFRDGEIWSVLTGRQHDDRPVVRELTMRRGTEVVRSILPDEGVAQEDLMIMLYSPRVNGDRTNHLNPTQRCELVNLGFVNSASIHSDMLKGSFESQPNLIGANNSFGESKLKYSAGDPIKIENIKTILDRDCYYNGQLISEIAMAGTAIFPQGGITKIELEVKDIEYGAFQNQPVISRWTIEKKFHCDSGDIGTERSNYEVTEHGTGKDLSQTAELFGHKLERVATVRMVSSPLLYVWDGLWAVPKILPLAEEHYAPKPTWNIRRYILPATALLMFAGAFILYQRANNKE